MDNKEIEAEVSESADVGEPGVHSTPVNGFKEPSLTESAIVDDSSVQSTPTSTKYNSKFDNDVMNFLQKQFNVMNSRFDVNDTKMNEQNSKFDELKIDINAVSDRCESNFSVRTKY